MLRTILASVGSLSEIANVNPRKCMRQSEIVSRGQPMTGHIDYVHSCVEVHPSTCYLTLETKML